MHGVLPEAVLCWFVFGSGAECLDYPEAWAAAEKGERPGRS